ncbi:MAG: LysE family translocator [Thermoguttaceae bacterium]
MIESPELFFAAQGVLLGVNAGLTPGPLTTLVVSESLRHGRRAGCRMALIPLVTDPPVLAILLPLLVTLVSGRNHIIGGIALVGGMMLVMMARKLVRVSVDDFSAGAAPRTSFVRGLAINITNPNLYIGWLTVNGTILLQANQVSLLADALFLVAFYASLVTLKLLMALAVGSVRHAIHVVWLVRINHALALAMLGYAVWFIVIGVRMLCG